MKLIQHVRQTQTLSLSQQEALQYLQLPLAALDSHLHRLVEENPLLELASPSQSLPSVAHQQSNPYGSHSLEYQDERTTGDVQTFKEMLLAQLNQSVHIPPRLLPACRYLIECLDHHGFLTDPLDELASETTFSIELLQDSLSQIQQLSPCGVGARNLEECLQLQLCERGQLNEEMQRLLAHGLSSLAHGNLAQLANDCHLTRTKLMHLIAQLQALSPYPSQCYQTDDDTTYIFPEATITEEGGVFTPEFHRNCVSNLMLNAEYVALLHSSDPNVAEFLKPLHRAAQAEIRNLDRRFSTVEQIILYLVANQQGYFHSGDCAIRPLSAQDMATALNLHPSTVRRALKDKYIRTPHGTIPLTHLLSSTPSTEQQSTSTSAICAKISVLVSSEDATHPLSDASIQHQLAAEGVAISRRTVTKYRESLQIPNSVLRKRHSH